MDKNMHWQACSEKCVKYFEKKEVLDYLNKSIDLCANTYYSSVVKIIYSLVYFDILNSIYLVVCFGLSL